MGRGGARLDQGAMNKKLRSSDTIKGALSQVSFVVLAANSKIKLGRCGRLIAHITGGIPVGIRLEYIHITHFPIFQ